MSKISTRMLAGSVFAALSVFATTSASAMMKEEAIVVSLTGTPRAVDAEGHWNFIKVGDSLSKGASVRTGEGERAVLYFGDNARRIALAPNSSIKIDASNGSLFLESGEAVGSFKAGEEVDNTISTRFGKATVKGEFLARGDSSSLQIINGGGSYLPGTPNATPVALSPAADVKTLLPRLDVLANPKGSAVTKQAALTWCPPPTPPPCPTPVSSGCK